MNKLNYAKGESPHSYYSYSTKGILLFTWSKDKSYDIEILRFSEEKSIESVSHMVYFPTDWRDNLISIVEGYGLLKEAKEEFKELSEKNLI